MDGMGLPFSEGEPGSLGMGPILGIHSLDFRGVTNSHPAEHGTWLISLASKEMVPMMALAMAKDAALFGTGTYPPWN